MRGLAFILTTAVLLAACGGSSAPPPAAEAPGPVDPPFVRTWDEPPGIAGVVMIVVDTLRADHLGVYGSDRGLTPEIDELAGSSYLFERAVAASSWTRPSIAAMLTSRFPTAIGLLDKTDRLDDAAVTLPEVLHDQAGFQTLAVITNGNISAEWGFDQGFERFTWPHLRRRYEGDFPIHVAEGVTQQALDLLDQRDKTRPFFLFVHYVDPHDPYLPHPEILPEPTPPGRFDGSREQLRELDRLRLRAEDADYDRIRYLYAGEVKYADHWIGRLIDGLAERGLADDVMITLTADHGEGLWTHGLRGHGNDLYEESVHVPLLVKLPGMTPADGKRIASPVSLVDLAPTILAVAGAPKPPAFQGFDLAPLTRGETRGPAFDYVYTEMDHRGRNFEAIRYGDWKLIRNRDTSGESRFPAVQMFDEAGDPGEQRNLAEQSRRGPRRQLADAIERWSLAVLASATGRQRLSLGDLDDSTLQNLRALGYVGEVEIERMRSAQGRREPGLATRPDLPRATASAIDFTASGAGHRQVVRGLVAGPDSSIWITGDAALVLARDAAQSKWTLDVPIDPGDARLPIDVAVRVQGGDPVEMEIGSAGTYTLEGPLTGIEEAKQVLLEITCVPRPSAGEAGEPAPDRPSAERCVRLTSVALR